MIKKDTVLILGAGASRAYGFPLGTKLKAMIWSELNEILRTFKNNGSVTKQVLTELLSCSGSDSPRADIKQFNDALLLSPDYSIDSFLEHHNETFRKIGKIGIASSLLPLEKRVSLYDDWMEIHIKRKEDIYSEIIPSDGHWYQYLFNEMCKGCDFENFAENNKLSIITFNYDRSLEYYLLCSLRAKYGKSLDECAKILKEINIIHVYGSLGELPELSIAGRAVPYDKIQSSAEQRSIYYKNAADSLRIIPEERETDPLLAKIWSICTQNYAVISKLLKEYPEFLSRHPRDEIENKSQEMQSVIDKINKTAPGIQNASLETLQLLLMLLSVSELLRESERIYFLGFGFLEDNMAKIFTEPGQIKYNLLKEVGDKCRGTAMGLSPHLKKKLATIGLKTMKHDLDCQKSNISNLLNNFPDCNIYDFLLHHPYSQLD